MTNPTRNALFCGSLPVASADEAFKTVLPTCGSFLRRMPDGESGGRSRWARDQARIFAALPEFGKVGRLYRLRAGRPPPAFPELGYAAAAITSYRLFTDYRRAGLIPAGMRFQVSLPTPFAVVALHIEPELLDVVLPTYWAAMMTEVETLCAAIPAGDLAVQWDVAVEVFRYFDTAEPAPPFVRSGLLEQLRKLGNAIPDGVDLGFHLCYGDIRRPGYRAPRDAGVVTWIANEVARLDRPITWVHLPVPEGAGPAWFEPLDKLDRTRIAELYLGLVPVSGKLAVGRRLLDLAGARLDSFGIATYCGMGRLGIGRNAFRRLLELVAELCVDQ